MDLPLVTYSKEEYVETNTGNKVYKKATLCGSQNVVLNGKCLLLRDCMLRGDLSAIRMGKFCIIGERTLIRPSYKKFSKGITFIPVHIGDHVFIEEDCVVMAVQICAYVHIGKGSVIGRSCIIKECCQVLPGSVLAPDSVFPPFCIIGGNPARVVGQLPDCTQDLMIDATKQYYENFVTSSALSALN